MRIYLIRINGFNAVASKSPPLADWCMVMPSAGMPVGEITSRDYFVGTEIRLDENHSSYIVDLSDLSKIKWALLTFYLDKKGATLYAAHHNQE